MPPCFGEPVLIKQLLANLISNAVKFTARRERAVVTIGATTNGETVYFVRDNGAGFDERFAEKLFGVFQRLHRTVEFEGTGVGLAIVQRIINRHGGRVWAEGRVDEGATFYFTLPPAAATQSGKHRVAAHQ
jgi:light-regulated signal transduction histidine kinase (bacteriophytochrome)